MSPKDTKSTKLLTFKKLNNKDIKTNLDYPQNDKALDLDGNATGDPKKGKIEPRATKIAIKTTKSSSSS